MLVVMSSGVISILSHMVHAKWCTEASKFYRKHNEVIFKGTWLPMTHAMHAFQSNF